MTQWVHLSEVSKGDVITVKGIDRSSDGLLVARVTKEPVDYIHICFYGGLNYRLPSTTRVMKWS